MPAATATLFGSVAPEPVNVTVTGLLTTDTVSIYREAPGEVRTLVRGAVAVTPTTATLLVQDVEAPFGRAVTYTAEVTSLAGVLTVVAAAPLVITDPGRHVLSSPSTGARVLVDVVADADERTTSLRGSVLRVTGRARPIALVDTRDSDTGRLTLYTRDSAETAALVSLLADGVPVVSREAPGRDLPGSEVLLIMDATRSRRSTDGDRLWSLPFAVVDTPERSTPVQLVDLADLDAYYTGETLADIGADFPTLLDLAQSDLGTA